MDETLAEDFDDGDDYEYDDCDLDDENLQPSSIYGSVVLGDADPYEAHALAIAKSDGARTRKEREEWLHAAELIGYRIESQIAYHNGLYRRQRCQYRAPVFRRTTRNRSSRRARTVARAAAKSTADPDGPEPPGKTATVAVSIGGASW